MTEPLSQAARRRDTAQRTLNGVEQVWEDRKQLVKKEMADASAARDANTIRLRALRLEKEQAEAAEAPAPAPVKAKAVRRAK